MESAYNYTMRLLKGGAKAVKSLGQNFLIDDYVVDTIVNACVKDEDTPLVEIGPGLGVLTRVLAPRVSKLWAIELDRAKMDLLSKELRGLPIDIINKDALKLELKELWGENKGILVGNLPYYITSPLVMHFLDQKDSLEAMIIMVQKEVADRLMASPGGKDYGVLSIAVQLSAKVEKIMDVSPKAFWPAPKVTSSVVRLSLRPYPNFHVNETEFFRIVKASFSQRRKTIGNSLAGGLSIDKKEVAVLLEKAGIDGQRRAETLSIEEFQALTISFYK